MKDSQGVYKITTDETWTKILCGYAPVNNSSWSFLMKQFKTFSNMKKLKLSNKIQDYFWGVVFTISALLWIYVASLFR